MLCISNTGKALHSFSPLLISILNIIWYNLELVAFYIFIYSVSSYKKNKLNIRMQFNWKLLILCLVTVS